MKKSYETSKPFCPEPGQFVCNQRVNIFDLSICCGVFIESCVNSASQFGHFIWNCFVGSFFFIVDLQVSTDNNYVVGQINCTS